MTSYYPITINTTTYTSKSFDLSTRITAPITTRISNDKTKMYVLNQENHTVLEYLLSTPGDITTATYVNSFDVSPQIIYPTSMDFSADLSKMYIVEYTRVVYEYSLTTAGDITTSSYTSKAFSMAGQTTNPSIKLSDDGLKLYAADTNNYGIFAYELSVAYDISTASYQGENIIVYSLLNAGSMTDIALSSDKLSLLVAANDIRNGRGHIYQCALSTPGDISTATYSGIYLNSQSLYTNNSIILIPNSVDFYVQSNDSAAVIYQYVLADNQNKGVEIMAAPVKYFSIFNGVKTLKQVAASELNNDANLVEAPLGVLPALDGSALTGLTATQVGLGSVDDVQQMPLSYLSTDKTNSSDTKVLSSKATQDAISDAIGGIPGAYHPKGLIDCSLNPNYPIAAVGDVYYVSVAGKIGGVAGRVVGVNDLIVCDIVSASAGDQATVGNKFSIASNKDAIVTSAASSSTDGDVVIFDSTSGKIIKESSIASANIALAPGGVLDAYDGSALTNLPSQANTISATADGAIAARDIVSLEYVGGALKARKANATDATKPATGFAQSAALSSLPVTITLSGQLTGLSAMSTAMDYYLDTISGGLTSTMPSTVGNIIQPIGKAASPTVLNFNAGEVTVIA